MEPKDLLQAVIRPTLDYLNLGGPQAEALILATGLTETGLRTLRQEGGPALGFFQMEPFTCDDLWSSFLAFRTDLRLKIADLIGSWPDRITALATNLAYATAMCRIRYFRCPDPLPAIDPNAMAAYWKQWYNTAAGAGTPAEFIERSSIVFNPSLWSK